MTYLSDKTKSRRRFTSLFVIAILLLVLSYGWVSIRATAYPYVEPTASVSHGFMGKLAAIPHNVAMYFYTRNYYNNRITALETHTEELENQVAYLKGMNASSDVDVNDAVMRPQSGIVLYSLAQDVTSFYSTLLLSKGFKDGITSGMLVYIRGRQPICVIQEVHPTTSLCKLFSADGNTTDGVVVTGSSTIVIPLVGQGGGTFVASVPKESQFKVGDEVMYKSNETMKLGTIVDIKDDPQDVFIRIYVRGAYNPVTSTLFYIDKE